LPIRIEANQNEEHGGKRNQRSSSIAHERQGYANYGNDSYGHSYIDKNVKE
jgi:hypothetical protein